MHRHASFDWVSFNLSTRIHACVWIDWASPLMPVIRNLEVAPVSTSALGGGVIFMIDDQRLTQCITHFLPVGPHGLKFDIFHEVQCVRMVLEHPLMVVRDHKEEWL